ncbi:MAG: hypothetical protein ACOX1S_02995 [Anaerostipes sp.]|jgi:hypothetical protein
MKQDMKQTNVTEDKPQSICRYCPREFSECKDRCHSFKTLTKWEKECRFAD